MPKKSDLTSLLDNLVDTPAQALDQTIVPNKFPLLTNFPYKIAIVGEAPGNDEVARGEPFVGMSGRLLTNLLSKCGIVRDACFIGNVCQRRPPNNDISLFKFDGPEIGDGLTQLHADLEQFEPNICLLLGNTPLRAAKPFAGIGDWRGSVFISDQQGPFFGRKCIAAYHPAACLRQYDWTPLLMFDIKKCRQQAETHYFTPPKRDLKLFSNIETLLYDLQQIKLNKPPIAIDIEGWVDKFVCISVAPSDIFSFIVPFANRDNSNFYSNVDDEVSVWKALSDILADVSIPKILQNSLYDRFVLQYSYGIVIRGVVDDTMLKNHELYCELEKSLGFMCSVYTDEPYYKHEGKSDSRDKFWEYCCRDSAVTLEINDKLTKWLDHLASQHYRFNIDMLNPLLYMELRGIRYNTELAKQRLNEINNHIYSLQAKLDSVSGFGVDRRLSKQDLLSRLRDHCCYKRDQTIPKKDFASDYSALSTRLETDGTLEEDFYGYYNNTCGLSLNIKGKEFKKYIYETLACPKQYHPTTGELTTNYEALLKIKKALTK